MRSQEEDCTSINSLDSINWTLVRTFSLSEIGRPEVQDIFTPHYGNTLTPCDDDREAIDWAEQCSNDLSLQTVFTPKWSVEDLVTFLTTCWYY